jgi:DNA-binding IclR family transcriptional regulator
MSSAKMKANRYAVPALEKGLDILETLAAAGSPQSLAELSKTLDRSPNELFRMLNCLEQRGYLAKDAASSRYSLTLKLFELAHTHSPVEKILDAARRPMAELTERVQESCHLSILRCDELLVIGQVERPGITRLLVEVGAVFNPLSTASGRLLLAFLPPDEREDLIGQELPNKAIFLRNLEAIRQKGISTADSETYVGVQDIAVLVGNPEIRVTAALAVSFLSRTSPKKRQVDYFDRIIDDLRNAAAKINDNLKIKGVL